MDTMRKIICIGNILIKEDAAGPMVFERLKTASLPDGVEVIDGGLGGLNLLPIVENASQVVFVDAVQGFTNHPGVMVLDCEAAAKHAPNVYDHAAGLAYLLKMIPKVFSGPLPEISLVGVEGDPTPSLVDRAAELAVALCHFSEHNKEESIRKCATRKGRRKPRKRDRDPNVSTHSR